MKEAKINREISECKESDEQISQDKSNRMGPVLRNMIIVDGIVFVLGESLIFVVLNDKLYYGSGFLVGVVLSIFSAAALKITLSRSLHLKGRSAVIVMVLSYIIRMTIIGATIAVLYYTRVGDALTALIGLLSLKLSAYFSSFLHVKN